MNVPRFVALRSGGSPFNGHAMAGGAGATRTTALTLDLSRFVAGRAGGTPGVIVHARVGDMGPSLLAAVLTERTRTAGWHLPVAVERRCGAIEVCVRSPRGRLQLSFDPTDLPGSVCTSLLDALTRHGSALVLSNRVEHRDKRRA